MKTLKPGLSILRWIGATVLAGGLLIGAATSRAESYGSPASDAPAQTTGLALTASAGFAGYYKDGAWIPVRITVSNDGPDLRGSLTIALPRGIGSGDTVYARAVELPTQSRREIFLYVAPEGIANSLRVSLVDGNKTLASTTVRVAQAGSGDLIYGVLAGSASAYGSLAEVDPANGFAFVAQLDVADLPPVSKGWQALDVLVVSDVDTGALTPDQRAALAGWVATGGRLIVAGGPAWQKTAAGLGGLLPLAPSATRTLGDLSALATFASAGPLSGGAVTAVGAPTADALVLAQAADGTPLVLMRSSGFGSVTYLAADPAFAPLRGWDGVEGIFRGLLSQPNMRPAWADGFRNWSAAHDAVNALPTLQLPSTLQVCGFLTIYLIVIGPLNYLVLKRLRRRELAWVTIPGIVLVFSAATYVTGYQLRGTQATLHQLAIVQVWPDSDRAQVDQLVGLFSPRRADYTVEFAPGFLVRPVPTFGSYGGSSGSFTLNQGDSTTLSGLRADVAEVEAFAAQGHVPAPVFYSNLTLDLVGNTARLHGTVTNMSDLSLTDSVLLTPGGVLRLGDFKSGETRNVSFSLSAPRAVPAHPNVVSPAVLRGVPAPGSGYYYPPNNYDSSIDDILGNSNYYNDREGFRRYSLLSTAIDAYGGRGRGNGIFLSGWASGAPASARVVNGRYDLQNLTLYLVSLRPDLNLGANSVTIPPGLMTWMVLHNSQSGSPTPYDMYLYPGLGEFSLRFAPALPLSYERVRELTLHLKSYGQSGLTSLDLRLWDFGEGDWVRLSDVTWGDTSVPSPARFVGPGGEIHVNVQLSKLATQISVESLDFTLEVER